MLEFELSSIALAIGAAASGVLIGTSLTAYIASRKISRIEHTLAESDASLKHKNEQLVSLTKDATRDAVLVAELKHQRNQIQSELSQLQQSHSRLYADKKALESGFIQKEKAQQDKLDILTQTERRLTEQFENLANKIFEKQSESFSQANNRGMNAMLTPLKEQIDAFKRQLNDQHVREGQERASLKTEILSLKALNQQITQEAAALTMALKGDSKQQGNWGEVVLERVLKESGLREGHEFDTQTSQLNDEGKQMQPDVVVHLPNDKDVVIDSKVSLLAYERFFNCDNEDDAEKYLKEHVSSIKTHIKGLSKKDYQNLPDLKTLDYVLMFIPIEPAFLKAIEADPDLVSFAMSQNIMLVSPTNLLVALRTINNIWQYEYQNQNAQKIADHAAKLYDKFSNFILDMERLGKSLETTQKHFDLAKNKLSLGRGNIVRQIEQFRELGVQPSKKLPDSLLNKEIESREAVNTLKIDTTNSDKPVVKSDGISEENSSKNTSEKNVHDDVVEKKLREKKFSKGLRTTEVNEKGVNDIGANDNRANKIGVRRHKRPRRKGNMRK